MFKSRFRYGGSDNILLMPGNRMYSRFELHTLKNRFFVFVFTSRCIFDANITNKYYFHIYYNIFQTDINNSTNRMDMKNMFFTSISTYYVGFSASISSNIVVFYTPDIDVVLFNAVPETALVDPQQFCCPYLNSAGFSEGIDYHAFFYFPQSIIERKVDRQLEIHLTAAVKSCGNFVWELSGFDIAVFS